MFFLASLSAFFAVQQATALPFPFKRANTTDIGNFGSCSVPQIKFATGFDNRKETSFEPVDQVSYNHGSAQNIDIITQFMCDALVNTCNADATAKATCATAKAAADTKPAKTGAQADAFNAVFGIETDFASVPEVDDQGNIVSTTASVAAATTTATTATAAATTTAADATCAASTVTVTATVTVAATQTGNVAVETTPCSTSTVTVTSTSSANAAATSAATTTAAAGSSTSVVSNASTSGADFGTCTTPEIKFAQGLDGRKETAFEPADLQSFNHGSADNIAVITSFICSQLPSACKANQAAQDLCTQATAAANAQPALTGKQADAFNAVFGIVTDFAAVPEVNDQGQTVSAAAAATATTAATTVATTSAVTTSAAAAASSSATTAASSTNLQTFAGALGGVTAPTVTALGNGEFQVEGNSAFNSLANALERSCDVQNNKCADAANASGNQNGFTVAACNSQQATCQSNASSASA